MGPVYGWANAYMKDGALSQRVIKAATHPVARVGTEAALFTALPSIYGDEDAVKFSDGPEFWKHLGTNTLIVGSMRAMGALVESPGHDARKFLLIQKGFEKDLNIQASASSKSVADELVGVPKEMKDTIIKHAMEQGEISKDISQVKKDVKLIAKVNSNLRSKEYVENASTVGTKENIEIGKYNEAVV